MFVSVVFLVLAGTWYFAAHTPAPRLTLPLPIHDFSSAVHHVAPLLPGPSTAREVRG